MNVNPQTTAFDKARRTVEDVHAHEIFRAAVTRHELGFGGWYVEIDSVDPNGRAARWTGYDGDVSPVDLAVDAFAGI